MPFPFFPQGLVVGSVLLGLALASFIEATLAVERGLAELYGSVAAQIARGTREWARPSAARRSESSLPVEALPPLAVERLHPWVEHLDTTGSDHAAPSQSISAPVDGIRFEEAARASHVTLARVQRVCSPSDEAP
jgi:hypothetical protein